MRTRADEHAPLGLLGRLMLAGRVWRIYRLVRRRMNREPLPDLVRDLGRSTVRADRYPPALLSRAVDRSLRLGPYQPRCLTKSLVLFRLLREQGDDVELVIGLPRDARDHAAHAWVEIDGRDVGPPPGRGLHSALARFP